MAASTNGVRVTPGKPQAPAAKRATVKPKVMPPLPPLPPPDPETDDFLSFWDGFRAEEVPKQTTILGVVVDIPVDLPLYYDDLQERMSTSTAGVDSDEAEAMYYEMLALLFGEGTLDQWKATKKLTSRMLRVLTIWGIRNGNGTATSFAEAGHLVREAEQAEAEGKPLGPNRAERRKRATGARSSTSRTSGTTGQPSKATSRASTAKKPAS